MPLADIHRARYGIRKASALVSNVAAATPLTLYLLTAGRTGAIRKIHVFNRQAAPIVLQIGMGLAAAFAQALGSFYCVNGQDLEITEEQIPNVEFTANITMQVSAAAAAPADVLVQVEVEEYQGPTG